MRRKLVVEKEKKKKKKGRWWDLGGVLVVMYPCLAQNEGEISLLRRTTTMILAARDNRTVCPIPPSWGVWLHGQI
jgi:hypothetical protein